MLEKLGYLGVGYVLAGCAIAAPVDEQVGQVSEAFVVAVHKAYPQMSPRTYLPGKGVRLVSIVRAETSQAHRDHLSAFGNALMDPSGRWFQAMKNEYGLLGPTTPRVWQVAQGTWDSFFTTTGQNTAQVNAFLGFEALMHGLTTDGS